MLKRIGAEEGGEFKAIASGTLPSGRPVIVNSDGTVSVPTSTSYSIGSTTNFESAQVEIQGSAYDSNSNRVVFAYRDYGNSSYATAIVGTVSGASISFGTPVVFDSASMGDGDACFDSTDNKIVISWKDGGNSNRGTAIVGTVSGTSISFGTKNQYDTSTCNENKIDFDSNSEKVAIVYRDGGSSYRGACVIGSVSGTDITFGTRVLITSGTDQAAGINCAFDSAGKLAVIYRNNSDGDGDCVIGTVSGASISFGSIVNFANVDDVGSVTYDSTNDKIFITFRDTDNSSYLTGIVGTISGTSISFGTKQVIDNADSFVYPNGSGFDAASGNIVVSYRSQASGNPGKLNDIKISGTSFTVGTQVQFESGDARDMQVVYDSTAQKTAIGFRDTGDSSYGKALVYTPSTQSLTSENYIGMSRGVAETATQSQAIGSPTSIGFSGEPSAITAAYDSSTGKVAISCRDGGNNNYGTTIIGTVSGTSISFGSPVVFNSETTNSTINVFDSSNNKIVTLYRNSLGYPHAKVGTISGTSISYGSAVQIVASNTSIQAATFDSTNNKVVVAYGGITISPSTILVGTVSGTSISFGSTVTTEASYGGAMGFDSTNGKVVLGLYTTSNGGRAYIGTVSGTSISFGSPVQFNSNISVVGGVHHDSNAGKMVIGYRKGAGQPTAIVGTVSGTSISFGSEVEVDDGGNNIGVGFDSNVNKVIYAFRDNASPYDGQLKVGTISGTSISFDSAVEFETGEINDLSPTSIAFDSTEKASVICYKDAGDSNTTKAVVFQAAGSFVNRAEVANGVNTSIDIIGSVSNNQIGLTAGQQYFVQTDGTISTTADDPSVLAGTAISATELVVKT